MSLCQKCANANCNHAVEPGEVVVQCGAYKPPMTNADRIRFMSDEEMAAVIMCPQQIDGKTDCTEPNCFRCSLKWLQQPAEDCQDERKENENV